MDMGYWNTSRIAVLKAMALNDPAGLRRAVERRSLVTWLRTQSADVTPETVALPWQAVEAIKVDFRLLQESDLTSCEFYRQADTWIADGTLRLH